MIMMLKGFFKPKAGRFYKAAELGPPSEPATLVD